VRVLALDTATENCSVALIVEQRVFAREQRLERGHAEHLLPMIHALLAEAEVALRELDAIAFGRGPGAFTGVRLAASVAQGLAFGAGRSVVPVSDLRALAQRALVDPSIRRVLACADARMQQVYWACFERDEAGLAQALGPERVDAPQLVQLPVSWSRDAEVAGAGSCGAGSGFESYPQLATTPGAQLGSIRSDLLPRAQEIAHLALYEVQAGRIFPPDQALPVYVRDEVTQVASPRSLN
jgi:tRNA threonylcarbamoyladenosine biosynthesis protein TsaB